MKLETAVMLARVRRVHAALLDRGDLTAGALADLLVDLRQEVQGLPFGVPDADDLPREAYRDLRARIARAWPEPGFYDPATGRALGHCDLPAEIGDALDDLTDLTLDLGTALALADTDEADALAWLRFSHDAHWGDHVQDVTRHLRWLG
ncbi:hypothetical protein DEIGR_102366 [Deinococcus grandis]|uniref:DUF5063 domain-containing protein n=1 Tax=Deinococcus grandis TaxID=57498 RepID=A0A100HMS9_9DEIO|nr:DUF5063 domain-containing protein [Deinococcus grandis]BBN94157.1 hypothetical protein DEGR_08900 [Deinococcus grandis]GAQ22339.1 hypothetical protein DEIGR_102366 [Deinococcus grandis]